MGRSRLLGKVGNKRLIIDFPRHIRLATVPYTFGNRMRFVRMRSVMHYCARLQPYAFGPYAFGHRMRSATAPYIFGRRAM